MPYAPRPPVATVDRRGLDPFEAAGRLGVSRAKLYELITAGEIGSFKIGSRRIVPAAAIDQYMERKLTEARADAR
jgi:excisionase family DNA binding protein